MAVITVVLAFVGKVIVALLTKKPHTNGHPTNGKSGDRSVAEWQRMIGEIVEKCTDDRVLPLIQEIRRDQSTIINLLQRIDAVLNIRKLAK